MKIIKRIAAGLVAIVSFGCSLLGCNRHISDGPGMVNDLAWKEFTLSRSDSYAQYNFWFTVEQKESGFFLTGECRNEDGDILTLEEGVKLSAADISYLRNLYLGELEDFPPDTQTDGPMILDAPTIRLTLTYLDGTQQRKILGSSTTIEIYRRFLPYF